jgi:RimJ/RimL family protein N-acetyltransferase
MPARLLDPDLLPEPPRTERFVLEPLHPRHNTRDHAAWMSSIEHIRATPGFGDGTWGPDTWPYEMTVDQNLADLEMHWGEFQRGEAFAYSVLDPADDDVIGCVYLDPDEGPLDDEADRCEVMVRSWVRASRADLDSQLVELVRQWLAASWPFARVRWPGR